MGFFERIDAFVDKKLIDISFVEAFYGYRYRNIIANRTIVAEKLTGAPRASWTRFIELGEKLERHRQKLGKTVVLG